MSPQLAAVADGLLDRAGGARLGEDRRLAHARGTQRLEVVKQDRPVRDREQMLGIHGRGRPGAIVLSATYQNERLRDLHMQSNGSKGPLLPRPDRIIDEKCDCVHGRARNRAVRTFLG